MTITVRNARISNQIFKCDIFCSQSKVKQMTGQIAKLGLAASAVSIVASVYIYFMHDGGDTTLGIFVGLWAPTLILFSQEIEKMME